MRRWIIHEEARLGTPKGCVSRSVSELSQLEDRNGEVMKGGSNEHRSLPGRVRARSELLARTQLWRLGYAASAASNGTSGRRSRVEGARREDSGGWHFGLHGARATAPRRSAGEVPLPPSAVGDADTDSGPVGVLRVNTWRKRFGDVTGESSTPSGWPVSPAYKPRVKGQGRGGGAEGKPCLLLLQGRQQSRSTPEGRKGKTYRRRETKERSRRTVSTSAQAQNWPTHALAGKPGEPALARALRNIFTKPNRLLSW